MKIENELKEILQIFYADGRVDGALGLYQFDEALNEHKSKILALGKPEPLAKNKQTQMFCEKCEKTFESYLIRPLTLCGSCSDELAKQVDATSR